MTKPGQSMIGSLLKNIWKRIPFSVQQGLLTPAYWVCAKVLFDTDVFETYRGITIAEFGSKEGLDPFFVPRTKEVLDFLAEFDPRRFRRVQSEIKASPAKQRSGQYGLTRTFTRIHRASGNSG